jgi:hypothetical protein
MTYKETRKNFVLPWQIIDAILFRKNSHQVHKYQEAWRFHGQPAYTARQVKIAGD